MSTVPSDKTEVYISIDVETSGPIPGEFSMLALGACVADEPEITFFCMLKPISRNYVPEAFAISRLSLDEMEEIGVEPGAAMNELRSWIAAQCVDGTKPVFVGLNAPFDWSFVNYYFHRFVGENPFGFSALDIKALYMGKAGCSWSDTGSSSIAKALLPALRGDHDALHDAQYQAELFRLVRSMPGNSV